MATTGANNSAKSRFDFHKRFLRKPVDIRVEIERFQEGLASESVNMSPSGICFELEEPLEDEEEFRILLYIPRGKEVEILKVSARMVWQEVQESGKMAHWRRVRTVRTRRRTPHSPMASRVGTGHTPATPR